MTRFGRCARDTRVGNQVTNQQSKSLHDWWTDRHCSKRHSYNLYYSCEVLQSWTQLESSLGAVSRIRTLGETLLPQDKESEDSEQSPEWPDKGAIEFQEVVAAYKYIIFPFVRISSHWKELISCSPETIALKGISVKISPGQKIGICGRTGRYVGSPLIRL